MVRRLHAVQRALQRCGGLQLGKPDLRSPVARSVWLGRTEPVSHLGLGAATESGPPPCSAVFDTRDQRGLLSGIPYRVSFQCRGSERVSRRGTELTPPAGLF